MRAIERAARLLLLAAWMGLITYWSGQGNLPIDQPGVAEVFHGLQHRVAHLAAFGLVGLLAWRAFGGIPRPFLGAVLLTSVFGAADEWHQSFTPGRHSGIDDWAWDTVSAAINVFAWMRVKATSWHVYLGPLAPAGNWCHVRARDRPGHRAAERGATSGRWRHHPAQRDGRPRQLSMRSSLPARRATPPSSCVRPSPAKSGPALETGRRLCAAGF